MRAQKRKAMVTLPTPPANKRQCSNTDSETDQPPPTLVATPDKTLTERRGSQGLYSEVDLSSISSASENLSEATSHSFTPCNSMRSLSPTNSTPGGTEVTTTVNVALVARIQFLEAQNNAFRQHYTGFPCHPLCTPSTSKSADKSVDAMRTVSSDAPFSPSELNLS